MTCSKDRPSPDLRMFAIFAVFATFANFDGFKSFIRWQDDHGGTLRPFRFVG